MLHCEACGRPVADTGDGRACLNCDLFVCSACAVADGRRCAACLGAGEDLPIGRGASLVALRRADRRVREVNRALSRLAALPADESGAELRFLTAKTATARTVGAEASAELRRGRVRSARLRARFERHAAVADDAIAAARSRDRAAVTGHEAAVPAPAFEETPSPDAPSRGRARPRWAIAAAMAGVAAVALVVAVGPRLLDGPRREDTLGGVTPTTLPMGSQSAAALPSETPAAGSPATSPTPSSEPSPPVAAELTFDEVAMDAGLGAGWSVVSGTGVAAVAPLPNAVDRSARLEVVDGPIEVCAPLEPPAAVGSIGFDLMVGPETEAAYVALDAEGADRVEVRIGPGGAAVLHDGAALATGDGIDAGAWYRSELTLAEGRWHIAFGDTEDRTISVSGLPESGRAVSRICLGHVGAVGADAHFDSISLTPLEDSP